MSGAALLAGLGALCGALLAWRAHLPGAPQRPSADADAQALRRQLAALEDPASLMPAQIRLDEARRLRAELAAPPPVVPPPAAATPAVGWRTTLACAFLLPLLAVPLYTWLEAPYQRAVAQAPTVPPEVAAMVARLEARLAGNGQDVEGWKRLGRSYGVMGRIGDAQRAYARAAALAPDDLLILDGYGALGAPPPHPPAIEDMRARAEAGVRTAPADARAWARLAFTRARLGDADGAREAYARAHALDPQRPELLAAYAAAEYGQNPQQPGAQAVTLYRRLLSIEPANPAALWVLGLAAYQDGDTAAAARHWQRLLAVLPAEDAMHAMVEEALRQARAKAAVKSPSGDARAP